MTDKNTIDLNQKLLEKKIQEFWEAVEGADPCEVTNMLLLEIMIRVIQIDVRFSEITDTIRAANDTNSCRKISKRTVKTETE